jgi:hypothetical protein
MQHVYIAQPETDYDYESAGVTKHVLTPLTKALKPRDFSFDARLKNASAKRKIIQYIKEYLAPHNAKIFLDSGGYDIIEGKTKYDDIPRFIENYNIFLTEHQDSFDYIFSLDIPMGFGDPQMMDKDTIYDLNKKSIEHTIEVLKQSPELRDKLIFVYQFKMLEQFEIWNQLYEELEVGKYITHRAIGGLVKLRDESPHIKITPFVSMLFRLFYDYEKSKNYVKELRIHVLGIAMERYRFAMAVVEKLFNRFGKESGTKVIFTYDTMQTSSQARNDTNLGFYTFKRGRIKEQQCYDIDDEILHEIYAEKLDQIKEETRRRRKDERLENSNAFVPLNLYSTMQVDNFFEWVIDKYDILDQIEPLIDEDLDRNVALSIVDQLIINYPIIFKKNDREKIAADLMLISRLWQWYAYDMDLNNLNEITKDYINHIKYPTYNTLRSRLEDE